MTNFQATLVNVGYGQLVLRDSLGKLSQKWTLSNPKCVIGTSSNCNVVCNLPGIVDHHVLMVIGARQVFLRALAPGLTRQGQNITELVIPGDQTDFKFEIAGHHFVYSRQARSPQRQPEFITDTSSPEKTARSLSQPTTPAGSTQLDSAQLDTLAEDLQSTASFAAATTPATSAHGQRLQFTFVRALEKNRAASGQQPIAPTSPLGGNDRPAWVEEIVREALRPVESRLDDLSAPLNQIQRRLRRQARQQKARQQQARQKARANQPTTEKSPTLSAEWLQTQINVEQVITQHNSRLDQLAQQVQQLVGRLASVDRSIDSSSSQHTDYLQKAIQSSSAISRLQQDTLALVQQLQTQLAQPVKDHQQQLWQTSVEAQLAELHSSLLVLDDFKVSLDSALNHTSSLKEQLTSQSASIQRIADRPVPTVPSLEQLQQSIQTTLSDQLGNSLGAEWHLNLRQTLANSVSQQVMAAVTDSLDQHQEQLSSRLSELDERLATLPVPAPLPALSMDTELLVSSIGKKLGEVVDTALAARLPEALALLNNNPNHQLNQTELAQTLGATLTQALASSLSPALSHSVSASVAQSVCDTLAHSFSPALSQSLALSLSQSLSQSLENTLNVAIANSVGQVIHSQEIHSQEIHSQRGQDQITPPAMQPSQAAQPLPLAAAPASPDWSAIPNATGANVSDSQSVIELTPIDELPAYPAASNESYPATAQPTDHSVADEYQPLTYQPLSYAHSDYPVDQSVIDEDVTGAPVTGAPVTDEYAEAESDLPRELPSWWTDDSQPLPGENQPAADAGDQGQWPGHNYFERNYFQSPIDSQPDDQRQLSTSQAADQPYAAEPGGLAEPMDQPWQPESHKVHDYYTPSAFSSEQLEIDPPVNSVDYGLNAPEAYAPLADEPAPAYDPVAPIEPAELYRGAYDNPQASIEESYSNSEFLRDGHQDTESDNQQLGYPSDTEQATQSVRAADRPTVQAGEVNSSHTDDGDESVEDYMRRLLARMRGVSEHEISLPGSEPARPAAQPAKDPSAVSAEVPEAAAEQISEAWTEPFDPDKYVPRGAAPEKNRDLNALRELANNSARSAIQVSARRRQGSAILIKSTIAMVGLIAGIALLSINGTRINIAFIATIASFFVALIWGYDTLVSMRPLMQAMRTPKEVPAKSVTGESSAEELT